jgi:Tfp pilus assembly protein PilV
MVHTHKTSRGVSLVEAMVALAVMAFGMLTVVGVQSTLRLNGDVAKQRSEAMRLAQETMERHRAFVVVDAGGLPAWADIVNAETDVTDLVTNTTFSVESKLGTTVDPIAKVLNVIVHWNDRSGQPQRVDVASAIAAAAPALSGTLAVRPGSAPVAPVRRPFQRHPTIPAQARDFGATSVFVLPSMPWIAIVFNNVSGSVTSICELNTTGRTNETVQLSDMQSCSNVVGQLLSGFVRFERSAIGPDLTAADVEDPIGPALNLHFVVDLTSSGHPQNPVCFDDMTGVHATEGTKRFATYYCVVFSNSSGQWSGTSKIETLPDNTFDNIDWQIGSNPSEPETYRVCRYTSATSDNQTVPNTDHPRNYVDVSGNLTNQNFVIIRAVKHCPTDGPADPSSGDFISTNTLQHQPAP